MGTGSPKAVPFHSENMGTCQEKGGEVFIRHVPFMPDDVVHGGLKQTGCAENSRISPGSA